MAGRLEPHMLVVSIGKVASVKASRCPLKNFSRGLFQLHDSNPSTTTATSLFPYPGHNGDEAM